MKISKHSQDYWLNNKMYGMECYEKFHDLFLSFIDPTENTELYKIYGIQDDDEHFEKQHINIMLCVENCNYHRHYKHYNKFGNTGNEMIDIYIYNHHSKLITSENYIIIPVMYPQIDYFKRKFEYIYPTLKTNFEKKKFCIQVSFIRCKNKHAKKIQKNIGKMKSIGKVDSIADFPYLREFSCYHSRELMNLFNQYKFVISFENSYTDGYITEKIFNSFFSRCVPIFLGPNDTNKYINKDSYIDLLNIDTNLINKLSENENEFNAFINRPKINNFDNEDYVKISKTFINQKNIIKYDQI